MLETEVAESLIRMGHALRTHHPAPGREKSFGGPWWQNPNGIWVDADDQLITTLYSTDVATGIYSPGGLIITTQGRKQAMGGQTIRSSTTGSAVTNVEPLYESLLVSALMTSYSINAVRGQSFVTCILQRNAGPNVQQQLVMYADYVSVNNPFVGWPYGRRIDPREGPGYTHTVTGGAPAAGANISDASPANLNRRLRTVSFTLTTSATVATRRVLWQVTDGTNLIWQASSQATQAASLVYTYQFGTAWGPEEAAVLPLGANSIITDSIPDLLLRPGYIIQTAVASLQAGDQLSASLYSVEEWISP